MSNIVKEVKGIVEEARKETFQKTMEEVKKTAEIWANYHCTPFALMELNDKLDKIKCPKD